MQECWVRILVDPEYFPHGITSCPLNSRFGSVFESFGRFLKFSAGSVWCYSMGGSKGDAKMADFNFTSFTLASISDLNRDICNPMPKRCNSLVCCVFDHLITTFAHAHYGYSLSFFI